MQDCPEGVLRGLGRWLRNLRSQDTAAPGQVALGVAPHEAEPLARPRDQDVAQSEVVN
jgi:hypothetical protein